MFDFSSPPVLAGWAGAAVVLWAACTFLFRLGCALADVPDPPLTRSALVVGLALALSLPLGYLIIRLLARHDDDPDSLLGPMRVLGTVLSVLVAWALSGLLYTLFLAAPYRKGLMISAFELLLGVLGAALLTALVLVVLAALQITRRPGQPPRASLAPPPAGRVPAPPS